MKLFKNIDDKFQEIGFIKTNDRMHVSYERKVSIGDKGNGYIQQLDLIQKENGNHLILSSQSDVNSDGFSNAVGITSYEAKLAIKKMKQKGWLKK